MNIQNEHNKSSLKSPWTSKPFLTSFEHRCLSFKRLISIISLCNLVIHFEHLIIVHLAEVDESMRKTLLVNPTLNFHSCHLLQNFGGGVRMFKVQKCQGFKLVARLYPFLPGKLHSE